MNSVEDIKNRDLFSEIERRANNLSLNGNKHPFKWHQSVKGLIPPATVEARR